MSDPIIEHKQRPPRPRQDTTISLLEAKLRQTERAARAMLRDLEEALVRCGYTRDGVYNSRQAGWTGPRQRGTVIHWENGKILLGRGLKKNTNGKLVKPYECNEPIAVGQMFGNDLIQVASHLVPFVDALENNVRHQVKALEDAVLKMQEMLQRVESDPMPSETPSQMSEDPDVEMPEKASE